MTLPKNGRLSIQHNNEHYLLNLADTETFPADFAVSDNVAISVLNYLPDLAFNEEGMPYSKSDEPNNPIVFYRIGYGPENARNWISGAASHAGTITNDTTGFVAFEHPAFFAADTGTVDMSRAGGMSQILATEDERYAIRHFSNTKGYLGGNPIHTGWSDEIFSAPGGMSIRVTAKEIFAHAREMPEFKAMQASAKQRASRWLEIIAQRGDTTHRKWMRKFTSDGLHLDDQHQLLLQVSSARFDLLRELGLQVHLNRFENDTDPAAKAQLLSLRT